MQRMISRILYSAALSLAWVSGAVLAAPPAVLQLQRIGLPVQEHPDVLRAPAFSPDGRWVTSSEGSVLRLRDATNGELIGEPMRKHSAGISLSAWSPDGRYIATGGYDGLLVLWDAEARRLLWEAPTRHEHVYAIAFSPDGKRIATGGKKDGTIRLWERATGRELGTLTGHEQQITALAFADNGALISTGADLTLRLWDIETRAAVRPPIQTGLAHRVSHLARHPRLPVVAVCNHDSVTIWNVQTGEPAARPLTGYRSPYGMSGMAFTPDGARLRLADASGGVMLFDWQKGELLARGEAEHRDVIVWQTAFAPQGDLVATAGKDGVLGLWRATVASDTGGFSVSEARKRPHPYGGAVTIYSHDGRNVAHLAYQRVVVTDRRTNVVVYDGIKDRYAHVAAFSRDGQWFAYAGERNQVTAVHLPTRRHVQVAHGEVAYLRTVAFSPDGSRIAIGLQERFDTRGAASDSVILAESRTGRVLGRYTFEVLPHQNRIASGLVFSPDGRMLLAATQNGDIARLDVATMQPAGNLWTGLGAMAVFSPDGRRVAVARHAGHGNTHAVIVDAASGVPLTSPMSPMARDAGITSLAFTPDGRFLLIAAGDRVITLWDAATGERLGRRALRYEPAMRNILLTADARLVYATSGEGRAESPFQLMEWDVTVDAARLARAQTAPAGRARLPAPTGEIVARMDSMEPDAGAFVPGSDQVVVGLWGRLGFFRNNVLRETGEYLSAGDGPRPDPAVFRFVAVSRDGRRASGAPDGAEMRVYDVASGKRVSIVGNSGYGPNNYVARGHGPHAFLADGRLALTWEEGVRIFDAEKGVALLNRRYPLDSHPTAIAAANRSSLIALGTERGSVLLTAADGSALPVSIERAHPGPVVVIAFSPDDQLVASGGVEGGIRLFDARRGRALAGPWRAHDRPVTAIAFSNDGQYVASGSNDGTLRLWSLRTGEAVTHALVGHTQPVFDVRQEADGRWLSFARDGTIRRWRIPVDECPDTTAAAGTVIGDAVNLRARPDRQAEALRALPFGTRVRILERRRECVQVAERNGRWLRVSTQDEAAPREGWLFDAFVMGESGAGAR